MLQSYEKLQNYERIFLKKTYLYREKVVSLHRNIRIIDNTILLWSHKKLSMMPGNLEHRE